MKIQGITIHKNKNCNTWYTRYRKDGEQIYISAKTQKECYDKLKEKLNIIKKEKQPKDYTLQSWYEKWLELFKIGKVKKSTIESYKYFFKYINSKILNKKIKEITSIEIQQIINQIDGERQQVKTFEFLNDIFNKAQKYNIIKQNPLNILEKPKYKKKSGTALSEEEQKQFILQCQKEKYGDIFLTILYQGLRKGEVLGITKKDIDIENKTLNINKSWNRNNEFDTTKNEVSIRTIPIFENAFEILSKYKNKNNLRVFEYSIKQVDTFFKKITKNCNFKKHIRIHDLRHTFITNCKNQNIPEHITQSWVGHSIGSKITSKVYTHVTSDKKEIEILNKFYSNSTQKKED